MIGLSQRYVTALRKHLKPGPRSNLQPALRLGRRAVALGVETLALVRSHERAAAILELSNSGNGPSKLAEIFPTEAIIPIVETPRAARQRKIDLNRLNETLDRRTTELAATNRQLQRGIVRRKSVEAGLQKSGIHHGRLLKDSLLLQEGLRQLTHRVLAAQEDERKKISREQDTLYADLQVHLVSWASSLTRGVTTKKRTHCLRRSMTSMAVPIHTAV